MNAEGTRTRVVVVLDDDDDAPELLGMLLEREGLRAVIAHSCEEARNVFRDEAVDAFIFDVFLPDGTGYDVLRDLPTRPRAVYALSGSSDHSHKAESLALGCDAHLVKPADLQALARTLAEKLRP